MPKPPKAAFFYVHTGEILVAAGDTEAELFRLSHEGKLLGSFASEKGPPGPIRAFGERVYWIVGGKIVSYSADGKGRKVEGDFPGSTDLAFDSKGRLHVASEAGVEAGGAKVHAEPSSGLFSLGGGLHSLTGKGWIAPLSGGAAVKGCACVGLERASNGQWLTADNKGVHSVGKGKETIVKSAYPPGRIGYLYRKDPKEDLLLVPVPEEKRVRAYKAP